LALAGTGFLHSQTFFTIRGTITDARSGEALPAANIRVLGSSKGTISNTQGEYTLSLESGSYALVFSYVAYLPETLDISLNRSIQQDIRLQPSPIMVPEVVVLGEDPALEIIRRAIAHKHTWMELLKSYSFDAFTRQVIWSDTSIAGITESYTTGYMGTGHPLREIVKQKRQTRNIPGSENLASVRRIVNFNEDEIRLFGAEINGKSSAYVFRGPTCPDALDNYDYKLLGTSTVNGTEIYTIKMNPKSRTKALFVGTITIASGTYAVIGVDVKPNESFTFPFAKDIDLRYRQQFALYDSCFWMPADIRIDGSFTISFVGLSLPKIGINFLSSIYDYKINPVLPDTIFKEPTLTTDSSAVKYDSTYWQTHEVLPLTPEQSRAYASLDSENTLDKQFQPHGALATVGNTNADFLLDFPDLRFDRVEGFFLGAKYKFDKLSQFFQLEGRIGRAISAKTTEYQLSGIFYPSTKRTLQFGGEFYDHLDNMPDAGFYGPLFISIMSLFDKNDYRDYFLAHGWRAFMKVFPNPILGTTVTYIDENESSLPVETNLSIPIRSTPYRANPAILEGRSDAVKLDVHYGEEPEALDIVSANYADLSIEKTTGGEIEYTRYSGTFTWNYPTFGTDLLFPAELRVRGSGGLLEVPSGAATATQSLFFLESRMSGLAPFGVLRGAGVMEFTGDRFVMLNLEHNFRSLPFLALNIPFLYRNSIELLSDVSVAQTWDGSTPASGGWYSEAGIGFGRIFDLLRIDVTYRFKQPAGVHFSLGLTTLF
jgi:hypothetical protein